MLYGNFFEDSHNLNFYKRCRDSKQLMPDFKFKNKCDFPNHPDISVHIFCYQYTKNMALRCFEWMKFNFNTLMPFNF